MMTNSVYRVDSVLDDDSNRRVMWKAMQPFERLIPAEHRPDIMWAAASRCISSYQDDRGLSFTSSLYRFTQWECKNFLRSRKHKKWNLLSQGLFEDPPAPIPDHQVDIDHIHDCMQFVNEHDKRIIFQYYTMGMTFREIGEANGYSRQRAHYRLKKAVDRLREICLRT